MITIYKITNSISGMSYIGQTCQTLTRRWSEHCCSNYCRRLFDAIEQHGKTTFVIEPICTTNHKDEADILEAYYISNFNTQHPNGYNLKGGETGHQHNNETKQKMSASRQGIKMTGKAAAGVPRGPRPDSVGISISKAKKGRPNGILGMKRPGMTHPTCRISVISTDCDTGEVVCHASITEAATATNSHHSNIIKALTGVRNKCANRTWKYKDSINTLDIKSKEKK